ncbi:hypothetical protein CUN38_04860 [Enterococcus faecium]|uniref:hypothetical protein n=1 Tax=Enterococcus faecium TaxID=1352 RepID=UPI000CF18A01|nr:hypothetical protein [Enterococcus faecium]PQC93474.1 hypothetical protein CUN38_04860 [Enterococcus faecium]
MLLTKLGIALLAITAIGMTQTAEADTTEQVDVITTAQPCDNKKAIVTVVETPEVEHPVVEQPTQDETQALQEAQEAVKKAQEAQTQAEHEALEAQFAAEANAKAAQQAAQQAQEANTWTCDKCGQQIQNNIPKEVHDKAMHAEQEPEEETGGYDWVCEKCGCTGTGPFDEHVCPDWTE